MGFSLSSVYLHMHMTSLNPAAQHSHLGTTACNKTPLQQYTANMSECQAQGWQFPVPAKERHPCMHTVYMHLSHKNDK